MDKIKEIEKYYDELKTIDMKKTSSIKSSFLSIENYNCKLNNGHIIKREKILKNNKSGSAAIILPITEDGKIILAIEPRVFTKKTVDIGLPAGYIENKEYPYMAAIRELEEETGYTSDQLELLGSYYQDQGCSEAINYYYIAYNCKRVNQQNLDEGEFIKYILVTLEELEELVEKNYIKGLNSAFIIEKGKKQLKKIRR